MLKRWWLKYRLHGLQRREGRLAESFSFFEDLARDTSEDSSSWQTVRGSLITVSFDLASVRAKRTRIEEKLFVA